MATLYTKLGVAEDASAAEIKRAYRKAAMKWHPDRNAGNEEAARATFLEIKDAYKILSDPDKRKVYNSVYATEMHRWETQQKRRHEQQRQHHDHQQRQHEQQQQQRREYEKSERARRERAEAAAQAKYQERVNVAMLFAEQGYTCDVLFGALPARDSPVDVAARIADSVWALQQARAGASWAAAAAHSKKSAPRARSAAAAPRATAKASGKAEANGKKPAGFFDTLWHSFFGVRS